MKSGEEITEENKGIKLEATLWDENRETNQKIKLEDGGDGGLAIQRNEIIDQRTSQIRSTL